MSGYSFSNQDDTKLSHLTLREELERSQRDDHQPVAKSFEPPTQQMDQVQKIAGLSIGLSSVFAEHLLSHPCIVLRRQCQVHYNGMRFHLTPFTLFQVLLNLNRHQGMGTLWKGIGSVYVVKGVLMISETAISEFTPLPKEITRHSPFKKMAEHLLLKSLSFLIATPFCAASLVETIQSDVASERPGVLDCLREGLSRVMGWGLPQTTRLLPVYSLVLPTVAYRLCHYLITSIAQYTVLSTVKVEQQETRRHDTDETVQQGTVYDVYFPELLAAFTGNLLGDMMLYPLETVLNRLHVQGTRTIIDNMDSGLGVIPINTNYEGIVDCFRSIIIEEGLQGLYKGFGALVMQYIIYATILKTVKFLFVRISQEFGPPPHRSPRRSVRQGQDFSNSDVFATPQNRSF